VIRKLYLRNFRNYASLEVEFSPKVNLIKGNNAQGKTNLLEALFFLSTGRSFRTSQLADLIRWNEPFFYLEAEFIKDNILQTIKLSFDGQAKKMHYNNTEFSHFTNLLGMLPTVMLAPEDINLIMGAPAERRRLLDLHIAQIDPVYVYHISRYYKAVKQRNYLLRHKKEDGISSWEQIMAAAAAYIHHKRTAVIAELQKPLAQAMERLSKNQDLLELKYHPSFTEDYAQSRAKEMHLGVTLAGPHRDDLIFTINGKEAKMFASQGQKRGAITALRLAQWDHFAQVTETLPILSIDDFGVHLDTNRHELLLDEMKTRGQVFLTSPYPLTGIVDRLIFIEEGQVALFPQTENYTAPGQEV
jgi:DNA replication and repair protein RecF